MRTLYAPTEEFIKTEISQLSESVLAGTSVVIPMDSNESMYEDTFIVIGYEGGNTCELQKVTAVIGNTNVQVGVLKYNHNEGEPVRIYKYDKRKFYGSLTIDGTYVELTGDGSPVNIGVDDPQGTLLEYTGGDYLWFKATYYNSATLLETALEDADTGAADESARYTSIYAIRKGAGILDNPFYSDTHVEQKRKQAESEVNSVLYEKYTLPLTEVPALVSYITQLLASGYIDFEEFGADGNGVKMLDEARALLNSIRKGTQVLIGVDGKPLLNQPAVSHSSIDGNTGNNNGDGPIFTMSQRF